MQHEPTRHLDFPHVLLSVAEGRNLHQPPRGSVRLRVFSSVCHRKRGHQHAASAAAVPGRGDAGDGLSHGRGPRRPGQVRTLTLRCGVASGA